jgi:hypothetical protein
VISNNSQSLIVIGLLLACSPGARSADPIQPGRYLLIAPAPTPAAEEPPARRLDSEDSGGKTNPDLTRFLNEPRHEKWKKFEDDLITFSYPEYPGMEVAVRDGRPAPGTKFYGQPIGSVDRQSSRFYSILVKGVTWAVVMAQDDPWFDEGICFCGQVVLRVYVPDQGCLRAYDLLTTGQLKKLQIINAKSLEGLATRFFNRSSYFKSTPHNFARSLHSSGSCCSSSVR